jgi:hypothetical protein
LHRENEFTCTGYLFDSIVLQLQQQPPLPPLDLGAAIVFG